MSKYSVGDRVRFRANNLVVGDHIRFMDDGAELHRRICINATCAGREAVVLAVRGPYVLVSDPRGIVSGWLVARPPTDYYEVVEPVRSGALVPWGGAVEQRRPTAAIPRAMRKP